MKEWGSDTLVTGIPAVLYFQRGKAKQAPMDSNTKERITGLNTNVAVLMISSVTVALVIPFWVYRSLCVCIWAC